MSFRRVISVLAVILAFAGTGALALAQTQSSGGDTSEADSLGLDPGREYPESFLRTAKHYEDLAPPESSPGPPIESDEVHIPVGPPEEVFVRHCTESASEDSSLDGDPLCRAVLLLNAGAIEPGVYKEPEVEQRYDTFVKGE